MSGDIVYVSRRCGYKWHIVTRFGRSRSRLRTAMSNCGLNCQGRTIPWNIVLDRVSEDQVCDRRRRTQEHANAVKQEWSNFQKGVTEMKEGELTELVRSYEQSLRNTADLKQKIVGMLKEGNTTIQDSFDRRTVVNSPTLPQDTIKISFAEQVLATAKDIGGNFRASEVAKQLGVEQLRVNWCFARLAEQGLLKRVEQGIYTVNDKSKQDSRKPAKKKSDKRSTREITEGSMPWKILNLLNSNASKTYHVSDITRAIGSNRYDAMRSAVSILVRSSKILRVGKGLYRAKFNASFLAGRTKVHEELTKQKEEKKAEILRMFMGKNVALNTIVSSIGSHSSSVIGYLNELIASGMATRITKGHYQIGSNSSTEPVESVAQS